MSERKTQKLIFLEGPACIGKTTSSITTFDFTMYLEKYRRFALKRDLAHVNSLYEHLLITDVMDFLSSIQQANNHGIVKSTSPKLVDRSHFSSIIYNILFYCDGHVLDHETYKVQFQQKILKDTTFCSLLADMCTKSWKLLQKLAPSLDIFLLCVIPTNIDRVVVNLKKRNTFETTSGFDLLAYTQNQIYTFVTLFKLINIGTILYTDNEFVNAIELFEFIK